MEEQKVIATDWKNKGNIYFKEKNYDEAIKCYSQAIERNPQDPTFYYNRALVYKKKSLWNLCIEDCNKATYLDNNYVKAIVLLGQSLVEGGKKDSNSKRIKLGILKLMKSVDIFKETHDFENEKIISSHLEIANRILRLKKRALKTERKENCLCYIDDLLAKQDLKSERSLELKKQAKKLMNYNFPETKRLDDLEFLNCRITLQLMKEPVITNEGHTYENDAIKLHMEKNSKFDPTTRKLITDLYPNRAIKKAVNMEYQEYITEEDANTDYQELHFN